MGGAGHAVRIRPEEAWARACLLIKFTVTQLAADTHASEPRVRKFIGEWIENGKVKSLGMGPHRRKIYEVLVAGTKLTNNATSDTGCPFKNMWRTMRNLKLFSAGDVALVSRTEAVFVDDKIANKYCQLLVRSEYLKVVIKAVPGKKQAVYRLIKDTGPTPPREKRVRAVWDGNLVEYTHVADAQV